MHIRKFVSHHRLAIGFVGILVAGIGALGGVAMAASTPAGILPAEIANAKIQTAQASAACPQQQCNIPARDERIASFGPAQPIQAGKAFITQAKALSNARAQAENPVATQPTLPAKAVQMTMSQLDAKLGIGADPLVAPDRPVWVVTVHGDMSTDGRPGNPGVVQHVYTEVIDAPTGQLILEAVGVDALG